MLGDCWATFALSNKFAGVVCERDVAGSLAVAGLYVQLAATAPAAFNTLNTISS
jgi:hypothetical protein